MQQIATEVMERMKVGDRLGKLAISTTGFVFDPQTGQSFTLNHSGMTALEALKRSSNPDTAARLLADTYDIPFEIAETSLDAFLIQLGRYL